MPGHNRGELSLEGYLLRILTALCRQSGGELRVSGAEVDRVGEATTLVKEWDSDRQQIVLRVESVSFREVYTLRPEKQTPAAVPMRPQVVDPLTRPAQPTPRAPAPEPEPDGFDFTPKRNTFDEEERVSQIFNKRTVARAAAILREELRRRDAERAKEERLQP